MGELEWVCQQEEISKLFLSGGRQMCSVAGERFSCSDLVCMIQWQALQRLYTQLTARRTSGKLGIVLLQSPKAGIACGTHIHY